MGVRCIVVEPEIEGNIGFLARVMANFDVSPLVLVNPRFQMGETARERAVHAQHIIDSCRIYQSFDRALEDVSFAIGTTAQDADASNPLRNTVSPRSVSDAVVDKEGEVAVVLGRESKGLSNDELELCDVVVTIPASEEYPVINMTHAGAIVMYELFQEGGGSEGTVSSRDEREQLLDSFKKVLDNVGINRAEQSRAVQCFKNVIGRSVIDAREARTLIGMFKRMQANTGD